MEIRRSNVELTSKTFPLYCFERRKKIPTFVSTKIKTRCSAARLAHLLWEQGVPSSNLGTSTVKNKAVEIFQLLYFYCIAALLKI